MKTFNIMLNILLLLLIKFLVKGYKMKILIIDDYIPYCKQAQAFCRGLGLDATYINKPKDLEHEFVKINPDVVLLDYDLKEAVFGIDILNKYKNPKIKFYANSNDDEYNQRLMDHGCVEVIGKDVNKFKELLFRLKEGENES